jgi:lysine 6-dehydrogenase
MKKIAVLGAGMVGSAMAFDLADRFEVKVGDRNESALNDLKKRNPAITVQPLDVKDSPKLSDFVEEVDLVISAVPGFLGYETLKTLIDLGKNVVDISFFPENALDLMEKAKAKQVFAVVDCGVAPGMGNILLGHYSEVLKVHRFSCLVGGLPVKKEWPFNYKAPFSPVDVIEEYTRPARYVENGQVITREALSDVELHAFDEIGTLESFNTDGLRSLIHSFPEIPNMKEKTLRYPGHVEYIKVLKSLGFFGIEPLVLEKGEVIPLELTQKLLFEKWKLGKTEPEFTIMRVTIEGYKGADTWVTHRFDLLDRYDEATKTSSMARTTGYTATAVASMLLSGFSMEPGIIPPEILGKKQGALNYVLTYLKERGVIYRENVSK